MNISQYVYFYYKGRPPVSKPNCWVLVLSIRLQLLLASWRPYWFSDRNSGELGVGERLSPCQPPHYFPTPSSHSGLLTPTSPQTWPGPPPAVSPPSPARPAPPEWITGEKDCYYCEAVSSEEHPATGHSYSGHTLSHGSNFLPVLQQLISEIKEKWTPSFSY